MFPIEVTVNHVPKPGGGRAFVFVTDITERQRAAAVLHERTTELEYRTTQLSQMAWDLTLAEHHAREELANTLHDGLQQLLVVVALNLDQQLKRDAEVGAAPSDLLVEAKQQLDEAIAVARSLNVDLFPPVLQRAGLPAALKWLANWTHDKYKLRVQITVDARADSARKDVRTLLFESVRELLFNAVKYAQTEHVALALELDANEQLCITVTDQGVGFDLARLDDRSKTGQMGWGLFRIRERLTLLGGRMDIDSAPGRGTRVRLVAPRDAAQDTVTSTDGLERGTDWSRIGGRRRSRVPGRDQDSARRRSPGGEARAAGVVAQAAAVHGRRRRVQRLRGDRPGVYAEARHHPDGRRDAAHGRRRGDGAHPQGAPRHPDSRAVDDGPE